MFSLTKYDNYIFDCDGVILDSNQIKSDAFYDVVVDFGEDLATKFVGFHKENGGISRHEKFRYFITNILKQKLDQKLLDYLLLQYQEVTLKALIQSEFVPGVIKFIENLISEKSNNLFVVSGGLEEDLEVIFNKKNIIHYFKQVLGSPKDKIKNVQLLIDTKQINLEQDKTVFFGDSKSDLDAANAFGFDFVYISKFSEIRNKQEFIRKNDFEVVETFELLNV